MYSQKIQEKVNDMLKKKISIEDIHLKTGISITTIKKWQKVRALRLLVKELIQKRQYKKALEIIDLCLEKQCIYKVVFISSKIKILLKQKRYEEAEQLAKKSLLEIPNNKYLTSQLLTSLLSQNKLKEAEQLAKAALEIKPNKIYKNQLEDIYMCKNIQKQGLINNVSFNNSLFELVRNQNYEDFSDSIKNVMQLKEYSRENPNDKIAMFILAEAYYKLELKILAVKYCKNAINQPNITIQDIKIFKNMLGIVSSSKNKFHNTNQKINVLIKKLID